MRKSNLPNPANAAIPALFAILTFALAGCATPSTATTGNAPARNVILFIGDGMGVATVTAARIYDGQSQGMLGEEHWLAFERFPNVALVKTYNTNQQVPDSAGTATAMMTGHKTRAGVINIGPDAQRRSCSGAQEHAIQSLSETAKQRGLAAGFVTTARVTHATPATVYAHAPERDWETNLFVPEADWNNGCRDIAHQLVNFAPGGGLDVAMGGGSRVFFGGDRRGVRRDPGDNLVSDWLQGGGKRRFVDSAEAMAALKPGDKALGLFARSHMTYIAERKEDSSEPSLSQMTEKAIELLADDPDGYFLMVEGGRIDHGHHIGKPGYAMLEAQEFNRAVEVALANVDLEETLVLVTADHSHVFTMGGYPTRGNPILGLVVSNDKTGEPNSEPTIAADGQPYTTLAYANGPGAVTTMPRTMPETGVHALAQSLVPTDGKNIDGSVTIDETHGGEDVALYATGSGAERVRGVIEQDRIFDIMMSAYGWAQDPD
jgi:alkaline phosphatase